jgi:hypothetical protein
MEELKGFKRANFFKGLVATENHWSEAHGYHIEKRKLQNRIFYGYGIVPGYEGELKVSSHQKGEGLTVEIASGYAIDGEGNDIFLHESVIKNIELQKYKLPRLLYVTIEFIETPVDFFVNEANPKYQGYRKSLESSKIEITATVPDSMKAIELARIYLEQDKEGKIIISEVKDSMKPGVNEIDLRFVPWVKMAIPTLSPYLKKQVIHTLDRTKNTMMLVEGEMPLSSIRDLQITAITSLMLVRGGSLNVSQMIEMIRPIVEIDNKIVREIIEAEKKLPQWEYSTMSIFGDYKAKVQQLSEFVAKYSDSLEDLELLLRTQVEAMDLIKTMLLTKRLGLNDIKMMSQDLPRTLIVGDKKYTKIDVIDFAEKNSEKQHNFKVIDAKDQFTGRQSFTYPDGKKVEGIVKGYIEGTTEWTIKNVVPNRELLFIRRFDYFYGDLNIEISVNGKKTGDLSIRGRDTKNRWRNWYYIVDAQYIKSDTLKISQKWISGTRDNMAKLWFYQEI